MLMEIPAFLEKSHLYLKAADKAAYPEEEGEEEEGGVTMAKETNGWRLNRQVNLSFLLELVLLGSLIVGSWFNLQRQLDLVGRDVGLLLERQKELYGKLETLQEKTISHEYRLQSMESASRHTSFSREQ